MDANLRPRIIKLELSFMNIFISSIKLISISLIYPSNKPLIFYANQLHQIHRT